MYVSLISADAAGTLLPSPDLVSQQRADLARQAHVKINPATGLTTDFANVFSELIMMLDLLDGWPEGLAEIAPWQPFDYVAHFAASDYADRQIIIDAYGLAPETARRELDSLVDQANALIACELTALRTMPEVDLARATQLAFNLRQLVNAMTVIANGADETSWQSDVDTLFSDNGGAESMSADDIDALFD